MRSLLFIILSLSNVFIYVVQSRSLLENAEFRPTTGGHHDGSLSNSIFPRLFTGLEKKIQRHSKRDEGKDAGAIVDRTKPEGEGSGANIDEKESPEESQDDVGTLFEDFFGSSQLPSQTNDGYKSLLVIKMD
jgi:hypothetical protein